MVELQYMKQKTLSKKKNNICTDPIIKYRSSKEILKPQWFDFIRKIFR